MYAIRSYYDSFIFPINPIKTAPTKNVDDISTNHQSSVDTPKIMTTNDIEKIKIIKRNLMDSFTVEFVSLPKCFSMSSFWLKIIDFEGSFLTRWA